MNETTGALALLLVVLAVAAVASRRVAVLASLAAFACFNFFFLPPVGTFAIAGRDNLVALFALLAVSLIGSHLSQQVRRRAQEAVELARQRNEAEMARRGAEAKSTPIASLSHDLKTPLTALRLAAGNLGNPQLSEEERQDQVEIVEAELGRLKRLFDNIADMASLETRAISAEREWVQPGDIVEAATRQSEAALGSRRVRVVGDDVQQFIHLDPRLTSAALAHVLENAAAYSPADAPIVVDVRVSANRLILAVRDKGPGVPPHELERIFERLYRANQTSHQFGSGMGLAIARGLLDLQGGRIAARNDPDGGAVFTIDVPISTRSAGETAVEPA
jgi:two-component system, OmpR family, sensor histidine kinase KdpD